MASINGLTRVTATSIQNSGQFYLGNNLDAGTAGQVIVSSGTETAAAWGTNSATLPNALTMGSNVSLASGNASFDGSVADTLNATGGSTITAGNGISLVGSTVSTNNDGTTINNTGGSGVQNQVLKVPNTLTINGSAFDGSAAVVLTTPDTTYGGSATINVNPFTTPQTLSCIKVPNTLTINGTPFDGSGSVVLTTPDTQLILADTDPITISTVGLVNTIGCNFDDDTIVLDGGELAVDHVPNELTFTGYSTGTYDGSSTLAINLVNTNTTYSAGDNINIGGPGNAIGVNKTITAQNSIQFQNNGTATTIIGSDYPSKPTVCTYLDLTSATNILPAAVSPFLGTKIQQTYSAKTFGATYTEYSSNFRLSFVAQSANALVEFQAVIAAYSRIFYGALYDYNLSKFWTVPQTQTRFKYDNGVDQDPTTLYWYLTGLTAGTTYYVSPYFRGNAASVYVYAGNSGTADQFAPGIFRVSDGGSNVSVY